jgi:phage terminase small subunit
MANLTEKQAAFVSGKLAGLPHREAAIHAGYAASSAEQTATKLMRHPSIKAALRKGKRVSDAGFKRRQEVDDELDGVGESAQLERNQMPQERYEDSMEFLKDAMNLRTLPIAARADYAKALLPFQHAKVGDKGKKQTAKERAAEIAGAERKNGTDGGTVVEAGSRFRVKSAPGSKH